MRLIIFALTAITTIVILYCCFWYQSVIKYNGKYSYDIFVASTKVGGGVIVIDNAIGLFEYSYHWPCIRHFPDYSRGHGHIEMQNELKSIVDSYNINGDNDLRICYGNGYNDGRFDFSVGKSKSTDKTVFLHINLNNSDSKLFLWASPWTEMKNFAQILNIKKID